jgi:peptidoglycan/LPS O-acetylase OafA/YrhL
MRKTIKRLFLYDTEPLETWLDLSIGAWGLYLALPFNTFASSPSYKAIQGFVPESLLGLCMMMIALAQFYGINGSHTLRRYALLAQSTLCLFIMLTFVFSNITTTGIPAFFASFLGCLFCYIKVTSDL